MKLASQAGENWQYQLTRQEADILLGLLKKFPLSEPGPAQMSKTDADAKAIEREKLLTESLAQHRRELKDLAANLLGQDKWKKTETGRLLTLNGEEREILLQILNDIRIGCWHALGEPDPLEQPITSKPQLAYRQLMELAGYFEMNLLELEA